VSAETDTDRTRSSPFLRDRISSAACSLVPGPRRGPPAAWWSRLGREAAAAIRDLLPPTLRTATPLGTIGALVNYTDTPVMPTAARRSARSSGVDVMGKCEDGSR
jgi:hypothetical protein